ncbi:MAG TPA: poly-gamma-glutamate hydrolase family protein [Acidimicrobiia bacterium]|nr:poly-gamma-glutamate hydrolase family protein [Acidimicrobiia bacterium]
MRVLGELLRAPGVVEDWAFGSRVGFLAVHGGLEPGTAEVAYAAAQRSGASYYTVSQPDELKWHIPTHHIDPAEAPRLAEFLEHVEVVVSVHGYWRDDLHMAVLVGGANRGLAGTLGASLRAALPDYRIVDRLDAIPPSLRGIHPANLVNLPRRGGVQLELPHPVRAIGPWGHGDAAEHFRAHTDALVDTLAAFAARVAA